MESALENKLRKFIQRCNWKWAQTYLTCPHEYIVRGKCALSDREFVEFVEAQREFGLHQVWGKYNNQYLFIDGYKYWTMGDTIPNTTIMNRQKLFGEYDKIADQYDNLFTDEDSRRQDAQIGAIIKSLKGTIYEIGCGSGLAVEIGGIDRMMYQGVDPSRSMIELFRSKHPEFSMRIRRKAFEEDGDAYTGSNHVISLYGSISYVMPVYLSRLARNHKGLFLMFYKPDYTPKTYEKTGVAMHHFTYTCKELDDLFTDCKVSMYDDYIIVTNEQIDWEDVIRRNQLLPEPKQQSLFE